MKYDDKISVLMAIYNCENTLVQAVESIINQTYTNWELILCDDGSTDNTFEIAEKLAIRDSRIIVIKNDKNRGLNYSLNRCIEIATGDFYARMDGDDDCLPERFEKQICFLRNNTQFTMVSSPIIFFDETGEWGRTWSKELPTKEDVVTGSPICHAPMMIRKEAMLDVGGYTDTKYTLRVEDVDLWIKLYTKGYICYNLSEPLYRMRNDANAFTRRKYKFRINSVRVRLSGCKKMKLGLKCYALACAPMIIGLIPNKLLRFIKKKLGKNQL